MSFCCVALSKVSITCSLVRYRTTFEVGGLDGILKFCAGLSIKCRPCTSDLKSDLTAATLGCLVDLDAFAMICLRHAKRCR